MMTYVYAGAGVLLGIQVLVLWRVLRVTRQMRHYDDRLAHFSDALALLTETSESGFQAIAAEVSRLSTPGLAAATRRTTTRRVATAARRGQTVSQIAAEHEVSEGEVRLRLHLSEHAPDLAAPPHATRTRLGADVDTEADHGALRA